MVMVEYTVLKLVTTPSNGRPPSLTLTEEVVKVEGLADATEFDAVTIEGEVVAIGVDFEGGYITTGMVSVYCEIRSRVGR